MLMNMNKVDGSVYVQRRGRIMPECSRDIREHEMMRDVEIGRYN